MALCAFLIVGLVASDRATGQAAPDAAAPDWLIHGVTAALLDPTPGVAAAALKLPQAPKAVVEAAAKARPEDRNALFVQLRSLLSNHEAAVRSAAISGLSEFPVAQPDRASIAAKFRDRLKEDDDADVRSAAATALRKFTVPDGDRVSTFDIMLKRLGEDADASVLKATSEAIGGFATTDSERTSVVAALRKRLDDRDCAIGVQAAAALRRLALLEQDRRAVVDGLRRLLECNDPNDAWAAALALGALGLDDVARSSIVSSLRERLTSSNEQIRISSIAALGGFAPGAPVVALLSDRLQNDPSTFVRVVAAEILALAAPSIPSPDRASVVPALVDRMQNDHDEMVRWEAAAALAKFALSERDRASVAGALREQMERGDLSGWAASKAVPALRELALSEAERAPIVAALGKRLEKDLEPSDRKAAIEALSKFGVLAPDLTSVVIALRKRLEDPGSEVRKAAGEALGEFAIPAPERSSVVMALLNRLEYDDNDDVREAAAETLQKLGPLDSHTLLAEWRLIHKGDAGRSAVWRAHGIVGTGAPEWPDRTHVLVAFLGHHTSVDPVGLPWPEVDGQPHQAVEYLKIFDDSWSEIVPSGGLKAEAAERVIGIVQHACSLSAGAAGYGGLIGEALRWTRDEIGAAWRALTEGGGSQKPQRCWTAAERGALIGLQGKLAQAGLTSHAAVLQNAIDADAAPPILGLIGYGMVAWALFWVGLICAFPYSRQIRAVYLFNDKLRGMLSLWFVPLLLFLVPGARRHLLRPFRLDLLRDARIDEFDENNWFPSSEVLDRGGVRRRLADAVPRVSGICLLVGESGLGKTLFLRRVAKRSRHPLGFLSARACVDGVPEAIVQATRGVQDPRFFESMIYTGSLALIIDGLNEVSAEARGKILEFVKRNAKDGNVLVSTQPLEWGDKDGPPVPGARILELQPLDRAAMEGFLLTRPAGMRPKRKVHGAAYQSAVRDFLRTTLDEAPSPDERVAAQIVLSNPMDLTYASELIAAGLMPRPDEMVGQAFELARRHYGAVTKREFPTCQFAKRVVELRLADRNWLDPGDFANEQPALENYRLLVPADIRDQDGKAESRLRFRHDKVMDFFLKLAFDDDPTSQIAHFDDPRFRGVYLLYAQTAQIDVARHLRDQLVLRAATTRDHALSDEFVRRLSLRDRNATPKTSGSLVALSA